MKLDTYASRALSGVFVTLPSITAKSTIGLVDELSALALKRVRRGYRLSGDSRGSVFATMVLSQIVDRGYALHGPETIAVLGSTPHILAAPTSASSGDVARNPHYLPDGTDRPMPDESRSQDLAQGHG